MGEDGASEIVLSEVSTRGGTLTSSLRSEPRTFNRIAFTGVPVDLYSILTGSKLVRVNRATQEPEAALVESWEISPDSRTYTLKLRDGVTWSDGVPFTSADVLFSFQAIYDPTTESPLDSVLRIAGKPFVVTAPDARTVVINLPGTLGVGIAILDNVTVAGLSPTLLDRYITAAQKISRLAVGSARKSPDGETIRVKPDITQEDRADGLPVGTRGGTVIRYTFPQDGEYVIKIQSMRGEGQDRAAVFERDDGGLTIALADGAGGTSNGDLAAQAVLDTVQVLAGSDADWSVILQTLDRDTGRLHGGQTTAVVVVPDPVSPSSGSIAMQVRPAGQDTPVCVKPRYGLFPQLP